MCHKIKWLISRKFEWNQVAKCNNQDFDYKMAILRRKLGDFCCQVSDTTEILGKQKDKKCENSMTKLPDAKEFQFDRNPKNESHRLESKMSEDVISFVDAFFNILPPLFFPFSSVKKQSEEKRGWKIQKKEAEFVHFLSNLGGNPEVPADFLWFFSTSSTSLM